MKINQFDSKTIITERVPLPVPEDADQVPEIGNAIRTRKTQMEGRVERLGRNNEVFFRLADGRLMKTPLNNVIVIEKLADEDDEIMEGRIDEISTEVLAKYKTAAGKDVSAADKRCDFKSGDKRFSGIVKATKKQFDNDAKKSVKEGPNDGLDDNFTVDDIRRLERIRDLSTLKAQAKELVKGKAVKRMKPEKISFFYNRIDDLKNPMSVIKLMYDLLLAGEGNKVIGSKNTMNPNSYRTRFGEGNMGGVNRCAPSTDVSYDEILNDVTDKWRGDTVKVKETIPYNRQMAEDIITELDKSTLGSYIKKASRDVADTSSGEGFKAAKKNPTYNTADDTPKEKKRLAGIGRAADKLAK